MCGFSTSSVTVEQESGVCYLVPQVEVIQEVGGCGLTETQRKSSAVTQLLVAKPIQQHSLRLEFTKINITYPHQSVCQCLHLDPNGVGTNLIIVKGR